MPPQSKRKRADRVFAVWAVVLLLTTVAVVVAVALYPREPELDAKLCPSSGPTGHVILLVDATDPFTFTQRKAVALLVEQLSDAGRTPQGTLLTVFVLGENVQGSAEPLFERCSPGSGAGKSEFTDNLELWQKRFRSEFEEPLRKKLPEMEAQRAASRSPILQMLQIVGLRYQQVRTAGEKRLIIVSDLLQNSVELSLYRDPPNYDQFRRKQEAQRLRAQLSGVAVEAHMLMNAPVLQSRQLAKFWEDYFSDVGARLVQLHTLPG